MSLAHRSENVETGVLPGNISALPSNDFSREVYCVLGIPIDAIDMSSLLEAVRTAAAGNAPFLVSTPNLNFLVNSCVNSEFRESLLLSDLCPADGMPLVWMARLLGLPIKARVAGSDMFEALRTPNRTAQRMKVFLLGGAEGVAQAAAKALNESTGGLNCVGSICPGFGTIDEMSQTHLIDTINASRADFLMIAMGAEKGQLWLLRNHYRLSIPVRANLGATINFTTGHVRRAPSLIRRLGFEWLWRIKEEPYLWRRYWHDGLKFIGLLLTRVLPLAIWTRWQKLSGADRKSLIIERTNSHGTINLSLSGAATTRNIHKVIATFTDVAAAKTDIRINLSNTCAIDARFLGLLLMLRKKTRALNADLTITGAASKMRTMFRLNGAGFLLAMDRSK